jgi:hypothetical protein
VSKTASGLPASLLKVVPQEAPPAEEWMVHADLAAKLEERGEDAQWQAKAEYEVAHSLGGSERQIAARVGKSDTHIHWLLTMVSRPETEAEGCTFADAYTAAKRGISLGGLKASTSVEWYTPARYIAAAREVMGSIDLDPASSALANEIVRADTYFSKDVDPNGLGQDWFGNVWLNPPYGKGSGLFTAMLVAEFDADRVTAGVLLLNAYGFDASWFQPLWDWPICFTDHRVEFYSPQHESGGPANGNIFAYLGPDPKRFAATFSEFGSIVRRWS